MQKLREKERQNQPGHRRRTMLPSQVHSIPENEEMVLKKPAPQTPVNRRFSQINETLTLYSPIRAKRQLSKIEKTVRSN